MLLSRLGSRSLFSPRIAFCFALLAVACASGRDAPVRSPALDYPHQPATTSDGQVVGADGKSPGDALEGGATTAHAAPGWTADDKGVHYDPKRPAGAADPGPPGKP